MTEVITSVVTALSPSALPLVVCVLGCIFIYFKIGKDRKQTKTERDNERQEIHDKLIAHDFKITNLQDIVDLHRDKLDSIDKQLAVVNKELVKLNLSVEHLGTALKEQNEIMKEQMKLSK